VLINASHGLHTKYGVGVGPIYYVTLVFLCVSAIILLATSPSFASQTRDQCEKCCKSSNQDEYYSEQCRLKCFRNPDHCVGQKSKQDARGEVAPPSGATPGPAPGTRVRHPAGPPPSMPPRTAGPPPAVPGPVGPPPGRAGTVAPTPAGQRPVGQPQPGAPPGGLSPRQAAQQGLLVFPSPLNLVPGRESEAAGQILNLNGIPPQHPNYQAGVQAITSILQNFARNNPSGGSLPTDDMQRVIIQLKQ
jgi:hypothetical protein